MAGFPRTSNWDGYFSIVLVLALGLRFSLVIKKSWMDGFSAGFSLGVTPEGTRTNAAEVKTGFHRIARAADAAVVPICIDFDNKYIRVMPAFETTEDVQADMKKLLSVLPGNAWPHSPGKLSAPAREALSVNGEFVRALPLDH